MAEPKFSRRLQCLAAAVAMSNLPVAALAEDKKLEEVVVTGSYIKRDSFDMTSPVDVMTDAELAEQGTPNLGEVLRNSTYNYGVESIGNVLAAEPQGAGVQGANFRGLGERATLTLLNGRRSVSTNLANLYPQIMVARTDALTDGGATLYGTDAVGGVFNIIPKKNFEGIEFQVSTNQADDWYENAFDLLMGSEVGEGRFVAGFEVRRKDALHFYERPYYYLGSASYSSTSWPGDFLVANRDATGAIVSASSRPDPGCGLNNDGTGTPTENKAAGVLATRQGVVRGGNCRWEFGANFDYLDDQDTYTGAIVYEYDLSSNVTYEGEFMFSFNEIETRGSPSNPGGRVGELSAIPGEHPGNPYRAFFDSDGDGRYEPGDGDSLLYAQDADGDGIPDRNAAGTDLDGNGLADVIVVGDEANPNGGIAFNEDVVIVDWRPVGYPFSGPSRLNDDRTSNGAYEAEYTTIRIVQQLNYDINDNWSGYSSYVYNQRDYFGGSPGESLSAIQAGLTGTLLVRDEASSASRNAWFNPFTTQNFACVNRDCSGGVVQTDPDQINTADIYDQVAFEGPDNIITTMQIFESILTGSLWDMPAGQVQTAFGIQYRDVEYEVDNDPISNALDLWIGIGAPDIKVDRRTTAIFGELAVPLHETVDLDFSVRTEMVDDISPEDLDHTDYRLGLRWAPTDIFAMRASYNTSFIAPSLDQLYTPSTLQGLSQITDGFTGISAFTARTTGGTPTLKPEEADIYNIGFSLMLLEGDLRFDLDYKFFDFTDRIIRPAAQEILDADEANALANGFTVDAAGLTAWLASGLSDPGILRSSINQQIQLITTDQLNAQAMEWKGFDMSVNYQFGANDIPWIGGEYGDFSVGVDATYVTAYDYTSFTGAVTEGAGKRNNRVAAVPPTPEWKANFRLGWNWNNHQVTVYGRYTDGIDEVRDGDPFSSPSAGTRAFFATLGVTNPTPDELPSYTTWDIQYALTLEGLIGDQDTQIQLGLINAGDKNAPQLVTLGGLETHLYDPRGQTWYLRIKQGI